MKLEKKDIYTIVTILAILCIISLILAYISFYPMQKKLRAEKNTIFDIMSIYTLNSKTDRGYRPKELIIITAPPEGKKTDLIGLEISLKASNFEIKQAKLDQFAFVDSDKTSLEENNLEDFGVKFINSNGNFVLDQGEFAEIHLFLENNKEKLHFLPMDNANLVFSKQNSFGKSSYDLFLPESFSEQRSKIEFNKTK